MVTPKPTNDRRSTLVTDILSSEILVPQFADLVAAVWGFVGSDPTIDVTSMHLPGDLESRSSQPSLPDALSLLARLEVDEASNPSSWLEVRIRGPAGTITLCNDLDLHVESGDARLLEAARRHFRSSQLRWYES